VIVGKKVANRQSRVLAELLEIAEFGVPHCD
jgi:hypothetical protein